MGSRERMSETEYFIENMNSNPDAFLMKLDHERMKNIFSILNEAHLKFKEGDKALVPLTLIMRSGYQLVEVYIASLSAKTGQAIAIRKKDAEKITASSIVFNMIDLKGIEAIINVRP